MFKDTYLYFRIQIDEKNCISYYHPNHNNDGSIFYPIKVQLEENCYPEDDNHIKVFIVVCNHEAAINGFVEVYLRTTDSMKDGFKLLRLTHSYWDTGADDFIYPFEKTFIVIEPKIFLVRTENDNSNLLIIVELNVKNILEDVWKGIRKKVTSMVVNVVINRASDVYDLDKTEVSMSIHFIPMGLVGNLFYNFYFLSEVIRSAVNISGTYNPNFSYLFFHNVRDHFVYTINGD